MGQVSTILVTGSSGQLGNELRAMASGYSQFKFLFFDRNTLDITSETQVAEFIHFHQPKYLVNAAAYTAVDKAEKERDEAMLVNAYACKLLATACKKYDVKLIHISTDYVFSGTGSRPYTEDDEVNPVNYYGETKLTGEQLVQQENPEAIIIRTSWVYSPFGKNFVKTMLRLMAENSVVKVVNDQCGNPTYAADLAEAIAHIISAEQWHPGIYHYSNSGNISWYEFALEIGRQTNSIAEIVPITTQEFPTPAKRPAYSVLDNSKIKNTYHIDQKDWKNSLAVCLRNIMLNT